nr:MAG TPA: hypothetical protein [Caudoviricetes sp.]
MYNWDTWHNHHVSHLLRQKKIIKREIHLNSVFLF